MRPRFLVVLTFCILLNQSALAYDDNAQQQINQIQQQLEQQFPRQVQPNQVFPMMQQRPSEAQMQMQQIEQTLQQLSPPQMQQVQQVQRPQPPQQMMQSQMSNFVPNGMQQQQQLPMINSALMNNNRAVQVGYANGQGMPVPNPYALAGTTKGVDILDESLRYHSHAGGAGNQSGAQQQAAGSGCQGQHFNPCNRHSHCHHGTSCGGGHAQTQAAVQNNNADGGQISTRAIGAIGAAALMGTFLSNGGIGGMMKSVGLDNSRHIRGASIGGY